MRNGLASDLDERLSYALNWAKDFHEITESEIEISNPQRLAIEDLISIVKSETDERVIQNAIFNLAKKYSLEAPDFFRLLYIILLGSPRGPRLGPYIKAMGSENVALALQRAVAPSQSP